MAFKPWLLCALVGLSFGCQLSPDQQLVGAWTADRRLCQVPDLSAWDDDHRFENGVYASQLKLSADHTFILTGLRQLGGKWSFSNGTLTLKPAEDSHLAAWQVVSAIRELSVAPDFTQMKITIPTHIGDIVIVLDKTA